jgi:predicted membrane-bound spermidine synthase
MTQTSVAATPAERPFLPLLSLLFVGSGLCALIYEVVWFQLLELVIGSSAVSLGVLHATFMGGMCIGSLFLPQIVPSRIHPLGVYAALELGIAVIALLVLVAVPLVGHLYSPFVGHGAGSVIMRAVVAGICLLPPTILIGAGVTAGSFVPYPEMRRIVICEIEPLIPQVVSTYFKRENNNVISDRRTEIVFYDTRSFILTTAETFHIITSDPIHPWVKGAAALYTKEYFEAVKAHRNPGGVVTH